MEFFQAAADVFRRGLSVHEGDKKLKEGFERSLSGLRTSWHKYLPSLDGSNTGPASTSSRSSTLPMPNDVLPDDEDDNGGHRGDNVRGGGEMAAIVAPVAAVATAPASTPSGEQDVEMEQLALLELHKKKRKESDRKYAERLSKYGALYDIHDLIVEESKWWSAMGTKWRDQVAAARDLEGANSKVTNVLLRYKVSLTAIYLFYKKKKEETKESVAERVLSRVLSTRASSVEIDGTVVERGVGSDSTKEISRESTMATEQVIENNGGRGGSGLLVTRNGSGGETKRSHTFASGNKYVGEFKGSKRNGYGTMYYANKSKPSWTGEWKNDKKFKEDKTTSSGREEKEKLSRNDVVIKSTKESRIMTMTTSFNTEAAPLRVPEPPATPSPFRRRGRERGGGEGGMSSRFRSPAPSSVRRQRMLELSAVANVALPLTPSHGMSQDMDMEQLMRFICECNLIMDEKEDMKYLQNMLNGFQKEKGLYQEKVEEEGEKMEEAEEMEEMKEMKEMETMEKMEEMEEMRAHREKLRQERELESNQDDATAAAATAATAATTATAATAATAATTTTTTAQTTTQKSSELTSTSMTVSPPIILFPKFCEIMVRLILNKHRYGIRTLTENEIEERKNQLKGLSLIDSKKKVLKQEQEDRPPNMSERLSRGLDKMLSLLGHRLVGTSTTNYRWIPFQERTAVQNSIKKMLPELRGIYLHLRKESNCINHISVIDFLRFLVQMDFVDSTRFTLESALKCYISITYYVGDVHLDLADFDHFVEALVCCADARTNNGGMISMEQRVSNFMKELLTKYERKCVRGRVRSRTSSI